MKRKAIEKVNRGRKESKTEEEGKEANRERQNRGKRREAVGREGKTRRRKRSEQGVVFMSKEKACRNCRLVVEDVNECPNCGETNFTTFWRGYVIITDPEKSEIAKKIGTTRPGKFALRLSR